MAENVPTGNEPHAGTAGRRSGATGRVAIVVVLVVLVAAVFWMKRGGGAPAGNEAGRVSTPAAEMPVAGGEPVAGGDATSPASGAVAVGEPSRGSSASTSSNQEAARAARPRLLDLGAGTCVPCKMMAPILEELRETYKSKLEVVFIDVRQDNAAAKKYGISVIPTQIFYDASGKELFRHQGFFSREDILAKWKELGVELDG